MSAAKNPAVPTVESSLYETDFFEWTQAMEKQLREGTVSQSDLEFIAEEIGDVGRRDRREVRNRMIVLIKHLIK